jgi:hypothetical protein
VPVTEKYLQKSASRNSGMPQIHPSQQQSVTREKENESEKNRRKMTRTGWLRPYVAVVKRERERDREREREREREIVCWNTIYIKRSDRGRNGKDEGKEKKKQRKPREM